MIQKMYSFRPLPELAGCFWGQHWFCPLIFIFELPVLLKLKGYFATIGWDSPFPAHLVCAVLLKGYFATVGWDSPFPAHLVCAILLKGYFATVRWDSPFPAHLVCAVLLKGYIATICWDSSFPAHLVCAVLLITERLFCHCWLGSPISSSPSVCCSPVAGKVKDPRFQPGETPHSCGEVCRRKGKEGCTHKCVLWVHSVTCTEWQSRCALSVSITAIGKCHRKGQLGCPHSYVL